MCGGKKEMKLMCIYLRMQVIIRDKNKLEKISNGGHIHKVENWQSVVRMGSSLDSVSRQGEFYVWLVQEFYNLPQTVTQNVHAKSLIIMFILRMILAYKVELLRTNVAKIGKLHRKLLFEPNCSFISHIYSAAQNKKEKEVSNFR